MEFIGIDIGSYKTIIASSKDNGKIITDEQGKRYIKTVMELTKPIRKFGNSITGEHELTIDLRHKDFFLSDLKATFMWLKYLDRTVKKQTGGNPTFCLAVPVSYGEEERRLIVSLAEAANIKLKGLFNDISAIGMFACIRREKIQNKFMIIDFGHNKTEVGVFEFENNVFKPLLIKSIQIGAKAFDEQLIKFIIHKHRLEDTFIVREKISRSLEKLKTVLNNSDAANVQFYITETPLTVQITYEEFCTLVSKEVLEIGNFLNEIRKEVKFDGVGELTGGNSSCAYIRDSIISLFDFQSTLDLTESCAIGASLGFACSVIKSKFTIHDIIGREVKIDKTVLFKPTDLIGTSKTVTYNKKESFDVEIYEGDKKIGSLKIVKKESEEAEPVVISIGVTRFGTIEVLSVESKSETSFEYHTLSLKDEELSAIIKDEEEFRAMEESIELIGCMRNDLETMVMNLSDTLTSKFDDMFSSDELDQIRNIGFELFDVQQSATVEEEEKVREEILTKLGFVLLKVLGHEEILKSELNKLKDEILKFNKENPKVFTPAFYKLQGLLYKIEDKIKATPVDLFNIASYEFKFLEDFKRDIKVFIENSKKEIKQKLEEEKRELEVKKAKEEEEKKHKKSSEQEEKREQKQQEKQDDGEVKSNEEGEETKAKEE